MIIYDKMLINVHGGARPTIDKIVIHSMAEYLYVDTVIYDAWTFLKNQALSAHYIITPSGVVFRCVPQYYKAWHCRGHNSTSIGVEFLVPGVYNYISFRNRIKTPYLTPAQIVAGQEWLEYIQDCYPGADLVRHSALDPKRKVDPGEGFPWTQLTGGLE